jgi:hypothetical protein
MLEAKMVGPWQESRMQSESVESKPTMKFKKKFKKCGFLLFFVATLVLSTSSLRAAKTKPAQDSKQNFEWRVPSIELQLRPYLEEGFRIARIYGQLDCFEKEDPSLGPLKSKTFGKKFRARWRRQKNSIRIELPEAELRGGNLDNLANCTYDLSFLVAKKLPTGKYDVYRGSAPLAFSTGNVKRFLREVDIHQRIKEELPGKLQISNCTKDRGSGNWCTTSLF